MKKWLFFTRSNSDIDSMIHQPALTTIAKKREFIGDAGATNFEVVEDDDTVKNPEWDGEKYIDSDPNSGAKKVLKSLRNTALSTVIVLIGEKEVWAGPGNEQNITGRIRQMELDSQASCDWIQGDDIFELTLTELKTVLSEGTAKCAKIFDDYITAIKAL